MFYHFGTVSGWTSCCGKCKWPLSYWWASKIPFGRIWTGSNSLVYLVTKRGWKISPFFWFSQLFEPPQVGFSSLLCLLEGILFNTHEISWYNEDKKSYPISCQRSPMTLLGIPLALHRGVTPRKNIEGEVSELEGWFSDWEMEVYSRENPRKTLGKPWENLWFT